MRTIRCFPHSVSFGLTDHGIRRAGCLTLIGGGDFADVAIEVVLDLAMLGQIEAEVSRVRSELRTPV